MKMPECGSVSRASTVIGLPRPAFTVKLTRSGSGEVSMSGSPMNIFTVSPTANRRIGTYRVRRSPLCSINSTNAAETSALVNVAVRNFSCVARSFVITVGSS